MSIEDIEKIQKIIDYFRYHNKNLTKKQIELIFELEEILYD